MNTPPWLPTLALLGALLYPDLSRGAAPDRAACLALSSDLPAPEQQQLCQHAVQLLVDHDAAAEVQRTRDAVVAWCQRQGETCDDTGWLVHAAVADAIALALCQREQVEATVNDSFYVGIHGNVYRDGEVIANCGTPRLNQELPFFNLPPVIQSDAQRVDHASRLFARIRAVIHAPVPQPRLFHHYLRQIDVSAPRTAEPVLTLLVEALDADKKKYAEALAIKLQHLENRNNYYFQPLGEVIKAGHPELALELLNRQAAAAGAVSHYRSFLCVAAEQGDPTLVRRLLDSGAHADGTEFGTIKRSQCLPLAAALANGHVSTVDLLLAAGAQVATRADFDPERRIMTAALASGNSVQFDRLLGMGAKVDQRLDHLIDAVLKGNNPRLLQRLVQMGVTATPDRQQEVLERVRGHFERNKPEAAEMLAILLEQDFNLLNRSGSGYYFARSTINLKNRAFTKRENYNPGLDKAHKKMVTLVLTALQSQQPRSLTETHDKRTLLSAAARNGFPEAVELLLAAGVDTNSADHKATALAEAKRGQQRIIENNQGPQPIIDDYDAVIRLLTGS